jgi:3-hydroxy acid dehydrogenase/malonic semialdehyde reductase
MATVMGKRLEGKTIVITGASSGIGKSVAQEFARTAPKNLKLILTARRIDTLKQIAAEISKDVGEGVKVLPVQLDVSKSAEVKSFVQNLPEEFKQIDVLVNNAGLVKGVDKVGDIKEDDLDVMFATNVTGLINMTQAVLPQMKSRGEAGAGDIINVGSIAGREPYVGGSIYCATKAAVRSFTESMRKELIATRIRVIEVDPGQVETEFSIVRFGGDKAKADAIYKGCEPLTPDDIAEIVVFTAGRRENVVVADTLVFPNHQVSLITYIRMGGIADLLARQRQLSCTRSRRRRSDNIWLGGCNYHAQKYLEHVEIIDRSCTKHEVTADRFYWLPSQQLSDLTRYGAFP